MPVLTHLVSVRVGAGQGLVAPVDGVGPAVQAVVVGGGRAGREGPELERRAGRGDFLERKYYYYYLS